MKGIDLRSDRRWQEEGIDERKHNVKGFVASCGGGLKCGRGEGKTEEIGNSVGDLVSSHKVELYCNNSHQRGDLRVKCTAGSEWP
jgi:hypothetical protein